MRELPILMNGAMVLLVGPSGKARSVPVRSADHGLGAASILLGDLPCLGLARAGAGRAGYRSRSIRRLNGFHGHAVVLVQSPSTNPPFAVAGIGDGSNKRPLGTDLDGVSHGLGPEYFSAHILGYIAEVRN